ncbi:hypothetical protein [Haloarchaeobius baliensis]|uniref:hypothetical protein n=1 Tax=Haloarchaeobius baliensis TaxID=1670458 RepID=UPI003F8830DB
MSEKENNRYQRRNILKSISTISAIGGATTVSSGSPAGGAVHLIESATEYRLDSISIPGSPIKRQVCHHIPYTINQDARELNLRETASDQLHQAISSNQYIVRRAGDKRAISSTGTVHRKRHVDTGVTANYRVSDQLLLDEIVQFEEPEFTVDKDQVWLSATGERTSLAPNESTEIASPPIEVPVVIQQVEDESYNPPAGVAEQRMALRSSRQTVSVACTPVHRAINHGRLTVVE